MKAVDWRIRADIYSMPEPNSGCRLWFGPVDSDGYPQLKVDGRLQLVHRLIWRDAKGPIPPKLCICHRCDMPPCIELHHLFIGSRRQNMRDMVAKGRNATAVGKFNSRVLSDDDVRAIRLDVRPRVEIAESFDVCKATIDHVKQGRTWRHLI